MSARYAGALQEDLPADQASESPSQDTTSDGAKAQESNGDADSAAGSAFHLQPAVRDAEGVMVSLALSLL